MLIDGFTVVAQALNFIVLVWLMKRFLYQPILRAIDAREERVAAELADADAKKAEAEQDRDTLRRKNDELDAERATLLRRATEEAEATGRRLAEEARQKARAETTRRQQALHDEARNLSLALRRRVQEEALAIARQALRDLAATPLEERIGEVFVERLRTLDGPARDGLAEALAGGTEPARLRSAFELSDTLRGTIEQTLDEGFSATTPLHFETAPDLIGGIELVVGGQKVAWSLADYLGTLEEDLEALLGETDTTETDADEPTPHESPA